MSEADDELFKRAKAGDMNAFCELFLPFRDDAWGLASRLLRDRDEANDAVQTTYLKAIEGLAKYKGEAASIRGWFLTICRNECFDRRKKKMVSKAINDSDQDAAGRIVPLGPLLDGGRDSAGGAYRGSKRDRDRAVEETVDDQCGEWDSCIDDRSARERLPPEEYEAYFLVDVMGFTCEEAAEIVGVPAPTMRSRVSRARQRLILQLRFELWALYHAHDGNAVVVSISDGALTARGQVEDPCVSLQQKASNGLALPGSVNGYDLVSFLDRVAAGLLNGQRMLALLDARSIPRREISSWDRGHARWRCLRLPHGVWLKEVERLLAAADHADHIIALIDGPKPLAWMRNHLDPLR